MTSLVDASQTKEDSTGFMLWRDKEKTINMYGSILRVIIRMRLDGIIFLVIGISLLITEK